MRLDGLPHEMIFEYRKLRHRSRAVPVPFHCLCLRGYKSAEIGRV